MASLERPALTRRVIPHQEASQSSASLKKTEAAAELAQVSVGSQGLPAALMEAVMPCPMCSGEGKRLYRVPLAKQLGSVPVYTACYFCYLKLTGKSPPPVELVPGSGAGSRS